MDEPVFHAAMLSPQGRIKHMVMLYKFSADDFLVEHCASTAKALRQNMLRYKLRADVQVTPDERLVLALAGADMADDNALRALQQSDGVLTAVRDPRHAVLGARVLLPADRVAAVERSVPSVTRVDGAVYDLLRTCVGVPSDPHELGGGEHCVDLPAEAALDYLHAVSYTKGCYVGQELTTRTHFLGTTRKLLLPLVPIGDESGESGAVDVPDDALFAPWADSVLGSSFGMPLPPPGTSLRAAAAAAASGEHDEPEPDDTPKRRRRRRERPAGRMVSGGWGAAFALLRLEHVVSGDAVFQAVAEDGEFDESLRYRPLLPLWWPQASETEASGEQEQ